MSVDFRTAAIGGTLAALVAGCLAAPAFFPKAFADEPASYALKTGKDIFPPSFDPKRLAKFDVTFDDSISADIQHSDIIKKIAFGHKTIVSVITTPSGTYSSDALTSPNVRYPGIDVVPKYGRNHWAYSSFTSDAGSGTWTSFTSGSITYYTYSYKPSARRG